MQTCTVVLQFNYDHPGTSLGSVWLFNGNGTEDLQQSTPLASLPNWTRVVGPVDYELASSVHGALKRFFERNGVVVIDEGVAD